MLIWSLRLAALQHHGWLLDVSLLGMLEGPELASANTASQDRDSMDTRARGPRGGAGGDQPIDDGYGEFIACLCELSTQHWGRPHGDASYWAQTWHRRSFLHEQRQYGTYSPYMTSQWIFGLIQRRHKRANFQKR